MANVVIIGPAYPLRGGGLATFNERLARAFQEQGDQVEIVTFSLQYPSFLFPGRTQFSSEPPPEGIKIKVLVNSVNPFNWVKVGNLLRKQKPDIVLFRFWLPFMGPCFGTIARLISRNKVSRILAITDNVVPHERRVGDVLFTQYFLAGCHGFITMSRAVMEDLARLAPDKPRTYQAHPLYDTFGPPVPKEEARRRLQLATGGRYILFFGFIRAYKGLDLLLQALPDPRLRRLNVKLIIAGEFYEDAAPYETIIREQGLEEHIVRATDFIPNSQVANYFCAADLVVQPYKHATQSGVSQVAYHFHKPMVVTDVGGLAESVPHGKVGYVAKPDPKSIAASIADFYEQNREQEFSQQVAEEKKKFSWEKMVDAIKELAFRIPAPAPL
jgi:glycosyltransferase involved in cell wall biosynthesis